MIANILIFFGAFFTGRFYESRIDTPPVCTPCTTRVEVRETVREVPVDTTSATFTQKWLYFNKDSCRFDSFDYNRGPIILPEDQRTW